MREQKANPGAKSVDTRKSGTPSDYSVLPELGPNGEVEVIETRRTDHFGPALGCDVTLPPVPKPSQAGRF